jgi:ribosomal protein L39E
MCILFRFIEVFILEKNDAIKFRLVTAMHRNGPLPQVMMLGTNQTKEFSNIPLFLSMAFKRPELAADLLTGFMSCRLRLVSEIHIELEY